MSADRVRSFCSLGVRLECRVATVEWQRQERREQAGQQDRCPRTNVMRSRSSLSSLILSSVVLAQTRPRARAGRSRDKAGCSHDEVSTDTGCACGRRRRSSGATPRRSATCQSRPRRTRGRPDLRHFAPWPSGPSEDRPRVRGQKSRSHAGPARPRSDFRRHARQRPARWNWIGHSLQKLPTEILEIESLPSSCLVPSAMTTPFGSAMACRRAARFGVSPMTTCS